MEIVKGNILEAKGIILHQVNCQGVMGKGLAYQINKRFPYTFEQYKSATKKARNTRDLLGQVLFTQEDEDLFIANCFGQNHYGTTKRHTDYDALEQCFIKVAQFNQIQNTQINIPYKIGCGLGGGDWNLVSILIEQYLPDAIVYRLK